MSHLQITPATEQAAHAAAQARIDRYAAQLAAAYASAKDKAAQRAAHYPNLISAFALADLIAELDADQLAHAADGEFAESITLNRALARLNRLIPNF